MKPADAPNASFAVVGAGAVGSYFGAMLARAGVPVTLIARPSHVEAIRRDGLLLETSQFEERVRATADTDIGAVRGAGIVLVCVKTVDTEDVARSLRPHLSADAVVISLQNGVDNAERMKRAAGIEVLSAVVYVAANLVAPGHVRHSARGDLRIGDLDRRDERDAEASERRRLLEAIADRFVRASIPCRVTQDIEPELWIKLVMNCAYNAVSALGQARYGRIVADPDARDLMTRVTGETVAVARARGVELPQDLLASVMELGRAMPQATSSMAQDLERGRRTEIESMNGFIAREGERLAIATPANTALRTLIRLKEQATCRQS